MLHIMPKAISLLCAEAFALAALLALTVMASGAALAAAGPEPDLATARSELVALTKSPRGGSRQAWLDLETRLLRILDKSGKIETDVLTLRTLGLTRESLGRRSGAKSDFHMAAEYYLRAAERAPRHPAADERLLDAARLRLTRLDDPRGVADCLRRLLAGRAGPDARRRAEDMLASLPAAARETRREQAPRAVHRSTPASPAGGESAAPLVAVERKSAAKSGGAKKRGESSGKVAKKGEARPQAVASSVERHSRPAAGKGGKGTDDTGNGGRKRPVALKMSRADKDRVSDSLLEQLGLSIRTVMVDAGHGGKDPGAIAFGIKEKDVNLRVAKLLGAELRRRGYRVLYVRTSDVFVPLEKRTAMANKAKADLFVSIHCNAHRDGGVNGMETYSLNLAKNRDAARVAARENAQAGKKIGDLQIILTELMLGSKIKESADLAACVQKCALAAARERIPLRDGGVKEAPFYVLMGARMPAVLAEIGFLTNRQEGKRLVSKDGQLRIARGIAVGIEEYRRRLERFAAL